MNSKYIKCILKFIFSIVVFFVASQDICIADHKAVFSQSEITRQDTNGNLFDSFYIFHATGLLIKKEPVNDDIDTEVELIYVSFDDIRLENCNFFTVGKKEFETAFGTDNYKKFHELFWDVRCNIPRTVAKGEYTASVTLNLNSLDKITCKKVVLYKKDIFIYAILLIITIFIEFVIYYFFKNQNILKILLLILQPFALMISCFFRINIYYGVVFYTIVMVILYCLRPSSVIHHIEINNMTVFHKFCIFIFMIITILICIVPMSVFPGHNLIIINGNILDMNEQYNALAQSVVKGHLYIDYGDVDEKLIAMQNPYDPEERMKQYVHFAWDHAFYNNKYYMYFGVLPVFTIFVPYQLITGNPLNGYHATQVFVTFFIIGVYSLYYLFSKIIFPEIKMSLYLALSCIFSIISIWYAITAPALYCTPICAGLCMEIWSIYFFVKSLLTNKNIKIKFLCLLLGSLFGSLVLSCRPPIFLANILFIPAIYDYLKYYHCKNQKLPVTHIVCFCSPYLTVGILLAIYNYLRFDNPFEFGLSYMLTDSDCYNHGYINERFNINTIITGIKYYFFEFNGVNKNFPYINFNGIIFNFPILASLTLLLSPRVLSFLKKNNMIIFVLFLILTIVITASFDTIAIRFIRERYRMDLYYLFCIICFIAICSFYNTVNKKIRDYIAISFVYFSFFTFIYTILLYLVPYDGNITETIPNINIIIYKILTFGL